MIPFLDLRLATEELRPEIAQAIARVVQSGVYILGAEVEAFEREFAHYCGTRHCVGVANGLDALTLLLRGLGIGAGDEVIVPSNTYIATWLAVSATGARVVPVEPTPGYLQSRPGTGGGCYRSANARDCGGASLWANGSSGGAG